MTIRVHSYVDGTCKSCGAFKNSGHVGPSWCSGRPSARAEANALREEVARLTRERDEARADFDLVAEALGLAEWPEGQGGCRVAPVQEIVSYAREARKASERLPEMSEALSMSCETPPARCECAGCSYAREKGGA